MTKSTKTVDKLKLTNIIIIANIIVNNNIIYSSYNYLSAPRTKKD